MCADKVITVSSSAPVKNVHYSCRSIKSKSYISITVGAENVF